MGFDIVKSILKSSRMCVKETRDSRVAGSRPPALDRQLGRIL